MKVDRSIDSVNECELWRKYYKFINNTSFTGASKGGTGVVFCPYVPHTFSLNNLYPNIINPFNLNTENDEIKTKIKYRQFKRFRATGC